MRPSNGEHCSSEALSKWGHIFFSEIKSAFIVEEAHSGSWVVNRSFPGDEETIRSKCPEAPEQLTYLHHSSSVWQNKKTSRNKSDDLGPQRECEGQGRNLDYRLRVLVNI